MSAPVIAPPRPLSCATQRRDGASTRRRRPPRLEPTATRRSVVWTARLLILAALLAGWQYLPTVDRLRDVSPVFDEFFVSSPQHVVEQLRRMVVDNQPEFWRNLWFTTQGVVLGCVIGLVLTVVVALALSNSKLLNAAVTPMIDLVNAVPTITMIPIIVLMFGPSLTTSVVIATQSVFFFAFFNAYAGGVSMPPELIHNAQLLGATQAEVMWQLRARYVVAWTAEVLPAAIGHALTAAFAAELFSGSAGLGRLVMRAILTINGDLTFAIVVVLSITGVIMSAIGRAMTSRYLHWWSSAR